LTLAERLLLQPDIDDAGRINLAYRIVLGRKANPEDQQLALQYLSEIESNLVESIAGGRADDSTNSIVALADAQVTVNSATESTEGAAGNARPAGGNGGAGTAASLPPNPDDIDPTDAPVTEPVIEAKSPKIAAWASFCQALLGSVEFRYLK